jgi:hypothetical protein
MVHAADRSTEAPQESCERTPMPNADAPLHYPKAMRKKEQFQCTGFANGQCAERKGSVLRQLTRRSLRMGNTPIRNITCKPHSLSK